MKTISVIAISILAAAPVLAEETRQHGAHEHGVGQLDIAFEGSKIAMEFHAPGADIVGFEYEAKTDADRAAIDAGIAKLSAPLDLFTFTEAANCTVVKAHAALESEEMHGEHDDHGDHEADHDDHEAGHADHDDHDHDHDEHAHDAHSDESGHTEFHAEYQLNCADPSAITSLTFEYFKVFPNALEVEVQAISGTGATAFEVAKDSPSLDLKSLF